ncbi:oligosaccharyl transferase, archaeosortase A system-associated [Methanosarcina sp.]|uniref:oligosaccharyl transferase, archaeosortase A system-associated n=1 Tax=Methanosarcina sp. TaxID=2213 RepID=UPI002988AAD0|nr:oligosaccharyl transferase, archaeosortase A system-associated [Methanosarcina sp.]MDW5550899.1 oligosaccharyl transferase, archaeosortase A system-associated [Methanosarcina sp.]
MSSQDHPVSSFKDKIKSSWPYTLAVAIIGFISLWVKTLPSNTVFLSNGSVRFATNDAWYHMRTLFVLLENYPHRMFFNPMTNYPNGSYIHFGPLFDQMMAIISLILGMGHPSSHLVDTVGAYFPAVLGALTVIPVYYIGKYLGGHKTGILAAILIAFAPGQFLTRSMIGFTDHHVAESLFSTLFMMFFMLALISAKERKLRFEDVFNKKFSVLKEPFIYSVLAGVMYSAYQLCWPGGSLFLLIVLVYAIFQYILDNFRNESSDYLGFTGVVTCLVSTILILPFVHPDMGFSMYYYSWFHVITSLGTMAGFAALSLIEREFKIRKINAYYYPLLILGAGILGLIITKIASPSLYSLIINAPSTVFGIQQGGPSTIGEATSIFYQNGAFTLYKAFSNFTTTGFLASILGMFVLAANLFRRPKPHELLVLVWSLFILLAIYGQNRFAYYYSINVSILSAYLGGLLLEKVKWDDLDQKFKSNVKSPSDVPGALKLVKIQQIFAVLFILIFLIYPVYGSAMLYSNTIKSTGSNEPNEPWMEACVWLRSNTPDPGMNYNAIYEAPKNGEMFQYPDTAYGVMSWWDYGHYIETIGHRMPNANPFQAGVGGRRVSINETNQPGAATFFTAPSEKEASAVLKAIDPRPDKMGARYVMSDAKMATDIFGAMPAWTLDTDGYYQAYWTGSQYQNIPSTRYFNSMEARLHIFDGNGLKQYRMVHETEAYQTDEVGYKQVYNYFYGGKLPEVDTGYVKVFEYVKGANITGTASPNESVKINTTILTNQGRTFEYSQSTTADSQGRYEFTVPYSTGQIAGQTQFNTAPSGPYVLSYGDTTKEVKVSEEAVLKGEEIKV